MGEKQKSASAPSLAGTAKAEAKEERTDKNQQSKPSISLFEGTRTLCVVSRQQQEACSCSGKKRSREAAPFSLKDEEAGGVPFSQNARSARTHTPWKKKVTDENITARCCSAGNAHPGKEGEQEVNAGSQRSSLFFAHLFLFFFSSHC
jgi:hypothetical protein